MKKVLFIALAAALFVVTGTVSANTVTGSNEISNKSKGNAGVSWQFNNSDGVLLLKMLSNGAVESASITVYDHRGRSVLKESSLIKGNVSITLIDLDHLPAGEYTFTVKCPSFESEASFKKK